MPKTGLNTIVDEDIFALTGKGDSELKKPGTQLTAADLQVLVLIDALSTVAQISKRVPGIARADVDVALKKLLNGKLIINTGEDDSDIMGSGFSTISVPAGFFSSIADATAAAEDGTANLKKKGYFVRIARRIDTERAEGWKPTVIVIDDDTDLQKLIRTYFVMEGFKVRAAHKRDEIMIALRMQPPPDLILLDVQLPDANGFDILARMRQHPVLKDMPVVMLTAEATKEAVLKGLQGGADGYITKPFEPDVLVNAVKSVLGLSSPPKDKNPKKQ